MRRGVSVVMVVALVIGVAGVALAWGPGMGPGRVGAGMGPGRMGAGSGPGMGGPMMMGPRGPAACPGWNAQEVTESITEDRAKEIATEYAAKYFKGFTVERIVPFTGRFRTMYQVELKGPKGEVRYLHVNPWGDVRPGGPPVAG